MNENVIEILGNPTLFNWYFNKRDFILMLTILLLLAISVYLRREISRTVKSVDYKEIIGKTLAYIVIAIIIVSVWNAINDPTTSGLGDSANALTYSSPKKD